jgi:hypothetical protein
MISRSVCALLLLSFASSSALAEEAEQKRKMAVGFYVNEIRKVDWRERSFLVDLYWWIRYPKPETEDEEKQLEALEFVNVAAEDVKHETLERKVVPGEGGEQIYVVYRTLGSFVFDADFRPYPFDRQRLPIIIEHTSLTAESLELVDDVASYERSSVAKDRWGVAQSFKVPDLDVRSVSRAFSVQPYQTDFGDPTVKDPRSGYSRATITFEVARSFGPYLVKILVPLLIILLLAYLVFFLPADELEVAAGLTVTSLLSCIAFQLTVAGDLPEIGYVVLSDRIFHLCYLLIMMAMAETVYTFNIERSGKTELAEKLETIARWGYPATFLIGVVIITAHGLMGT